MDELAYPLDRFTEDSRRARLALQGLVNGSLGGIFDGPTSVHLDFADAGTVLDLRVVRSSDQLAAMALTCAQSWLEAELSHPDAPPRLCIYDEFSLIARHLPLVRRMREQLKLARALGIGNVLAFHRFSDLEATGTAGSEQVAIARGLIEDSGVRVSYRQAPGSIDSAREFMGTTNVEAELLCHLRQGTALWKIGTRSYVVKHQLSTIEERMVNTDARMVQHPTGHDQLDESQYDIRLDAAMGAVGGGI